MPKIANLIRPTSEPRTSESTRKNTSDGFSPGWGASDQLSRVRCFYNDPSEATNTKEPSCFTRFFRSSKPVQSSDTAPQQPTKKTGCWPPGLFNKSKPVASSDSSLELETAAAKKPTRSWNPFKNCSNPFKNWDRGTWGAALIIGGIVLGVATIVAACVFTGGIAAVVVAILALVAGLSATAGAVCLETNHKCEH